MNSTRAQVDPPKLSPALFRAVASETTGFVDRAILGKEDVTALKDLLTRRDAPRIELKRALGALTRSDPSPDTARILARVLADGKAQARDRALAAAYLGQLPCLVAEAPLLAALDAAPNPLRAEIIKSLGQIGGAKALKKLSAIKYDDDDPARSQLGLAKLAITLRDGGNKVDAGAIDDALQLRWDTAQSKRLKPDALRTVHAAIGGTRFGAALSQELGFELVCGKQRHAILLDDTLKRGSLVEGLSKRGMIAAQLFTRAANPGYYALRWLLLTSPEKDGLRMVLVRPNGDAAFEGHAKRDDRGLSFALRDTGLERTPTKITGYVSADDIAWTLEQSRGRLRGKRRPQPIRPAPIRR